MKPNSAAFLSCLFLIALSAGCNLSNVREPATASGENRQSAKPAAQPPTVLSSQSEKAEQALSGGIASYENGSYSLAARQLQSALTLGLESPSRQAAAHKYLAFIHCVGGRKNSCRDEFRKAIEADPDFVLTPAEAGHPTWGPVFRKLKTGSKPVKK